MREPLGTKRPLQTECALSPWSPGCGNTAGSLPVTCLQSSCNLSLGSVTWGDRNPPPKRFTCPFGGFPQHGALPASACVSKPLLCDVSARVCLPYSLIKGSHVFSSHPANGYPIAAGRLGYTAPMITPLAVTTGSTRPGDLVETFPIGSSLTSMPAFMMKKGTISVFNDGGSRNGKQSGQREGRHLPWVTPHRSSML